MVDKVMSDPMGEWTCDQCEEHEKRVNAADFTSPDWQPRIDQAVTHLLRHLGHQARPGEPLNKHSDAYGVNPLPQAFELAAHTKCVELGDGVCEGHGHAAQSPAAESPALALVRQWKQSTWSVAQKFAWGDFETLETAILAQEKAHQKAIAFEKGKWINLDNQTQVEIKALNKQVEQLQRELEDTKTEFRKCVGYVVERTQERDAARQARRELITEVRHQVSLMARHTKGAGIREILEDACDKAEKEGLGGGGTNRI